jgi:hypothetical protein
MYRTVREENAMFRPWKRILAPPDEIPAKDMVAEQGTRQSFWQFARWVGPALMVSIAYMDPGNYGTGIAAGAG